LDVVNNKEKDENIFKLEFSHPTIDIKNHEQLRIDFIGLWFQSIVVQAMQSGFEHILLSFSSTDFGHAPDSLVLASICSSILELIPKVQLDA
jgi:hypothetical protein